MDLPLQLFNLSPSYQFSRELIGYSAFWQHTHYVWLFNSLENLKGTHHRKSTDNGFSNLPHPFEKLGICMYFAKNM